MAEFANETSDMDNLPTPPRLSQGDNSNNQPSTPAQIYTDSRGSPHSIDLETNQNDKAVTPAKHVRTVGHHGRSSSPRPKSNSPSEFLLKTTKARVCDGDVLNERRRSSIASPEAPKSAHKRTPASVGPSERLMKTTIARVSDVRAWHATKGVIKHEEDIWWEQRKPLADASKHNLKVESRLYEPTTSHIYSQRKKYPHRTTPDKNAVPGSAEKSPIPGRNGSPLKVAKINAESPLLRTTINATVKNVKNTPVPPPPPALEILTHSSGPQNVASRLFSPTTCTRAAKWKSREELAAEEAAAAARSQPVKKVKAPSSHLLSYNTAMQYSVRTKVEKVEGDRRELGWSNGFVKDHIPEVSEVPPLPGQRLGASPLRRRSDGGNSRGEFRNSLGSSLESVEPQMDMENEHEQDLMGSPMNGHSNGFHSNDEEQLNGHGLGNNEEFGATQSEAMEEVEGVEAVDHAQQIVEQGPGSAVADEEFESY